MTEFIIAGGPFMWPLLACSILVITISVERLWFLQLRLVSPNGLTNQVVNLHNKNLINIKQSEEISELSSLGFLLMSCIKYKDLPRENLESKIEEKAIEVKYLLERNLNMLGTIATISPLLGLLGTVIGMIVAFTGLSETTGANPDALASGISQALITTAFGLLIAVPGLVLHKYFEQKVNYLLITLQIEVSRFIDVINK
ncbi:MAG: MotA/TolQ/ExbB proton channel family protein [SAR86 cluster bacterium]|jgi:biopolymer transport protein ExbB|uniref:MotA/TolQ/ExbB proton channel family protein n=1 Tax=SAR86 cluster bacterium TaxID=2030880 RepID=A0A937I5I1_9GAMM|nr:MotA/TolQ/ExbB proton channel family protein [SAR86 cluster bacterium]MDA0976146.1 MotA/TolQ/ExbB proton channel family protein [Pseudomonadota bacterium]MDA1037680.1 MotA/TolQ/ExbB proton channel family protein [Pseudomonadota bacterium]